jgi:hypothetical protein
LYIERWWNNMDAIKKGIIELELLKIKEEMEKIKNEY